MTQENIILALQNNLIPTTSDKADQLITTDKYFPGLPLVKRIYNRTESYVAVVGTAPRTGFNALYNADGTWYIIPILSDLTSFRQLKGVYAKCNVIVGFAPNASVADEMVAFGKTISAPLQFVGGVSKTLNKPTAKHPSSYNIKISKNLPIQIDYVNLNKQFSEANWD